MDSPIAQKDEFSKHCQVDGIQICTRCGSVHIKILNDTITCSDCNAILCYAHKNEQS